MSILVIYAHVSPYITSGVRKTPGIILYKIIHLYSQNTDAQRNDKTIQCNTADLGLTLNVLTPKFNGLFPSELWELHV